MATVSSVPTTNTRRASAPLIPQWATEAATWIIKQPPAWRVVGGIIGGIMLALGVFLLLGGGYTSIQGVRIPVAQILARFGVVIEVSTFPPLAWWSIPILNNFIQIFGKHIPGLRRFWWPSIVYDSITTALYLVLALMILLPLNWAALIPFLTVGCAGSLLALGITVAAERVFFGSFALLGAALFSRVL